MKFGEENGSRLKIIPDQGCHGFSLLFPLDVSTPALSVVLHVRAVLDHTENLKISWFKNVYPAKSYCRCTEAIHQNRLDVNR